MSCCPKISYTIYCGCDFFANKNKGSYNTDLCCVNVRAYEGLRGILSTLLTGKNYEVIINYGAFGNVRSE